eukprot:Lankesteria_metandrocarpae@DN5256_c1_g2_i16.p1
MMNPVNQAELAVLWLFLMVTIPVPLHANFAFDLLELNAEELREGTSNRVLRHPTTCLHQAQKGDILQISLLASSPGMSEMLKEKFGAEAMDVDRSVRQTFKLQDHNVEPLNAEMVGMCKGEVRRIGLSVMGTKLFYTISLEEVLDQHSDEL